MSNFDVLSELCRDKVVSNDRSYYSILKMWMDALLYKKPQYHCFTLKTVRLSSQIDAIRVTAAINVFFTIYVYISLIFCSGTG